jgi:hypothetical protein
MAPGYITFGWKFSPDSFPAGQKPFARSINPAKVRSWLTIFYIISVFVILMSLNNLPDRASYSFQGDLRVVLDFTS